MVVHTSKILLVLMLLSSIESCSSSNQRTPSRRGSDQNGTGGDGSTSAQTGDLDCESQWALALRQQSQGTQFVYDSTFSSIVSDQFDRNVVITAASQDRITQSISVTSTYVNSFAPKLNGQTVTLEKSKFLQACANSQPQPIAMSTLGGQLVVTRSGSDTLTLQGRQIPVQRVDMQLNNVTYAGYQVTATVQMYVSSKYPALPLKQILTITDCPTLQLIKGAQFVDILKSPLPTAK